MKKITQKKVFLPITLIIATIAIMITINEVNAMKITEQESIKKYDKTYDIEEKTETSKYLNFKAETPLSAANKTDKKHQAWVNKEENEFKDELEKYGKRTPAHFSLETKIEKIDDYLYLIKLLSNYNINDEKSDENTIIYTVDTKKDKHLTFEDILKEDFSKKKLKKALSIDSDKSLEKIKESSWTKANNNIEVFDQKGNKTIETFELEDFYNFINDQYYDELITGEVAEKVKEIEAEKERIRKEKERKKKEEEARKEAEKLKQEQNNKDSKKDNQGRIALTFDDGPDPKVTPLILDTLDKYDVKATFFMLSKNVLAYPELAKEVASRGHEIANHSMNHLDLSKQSQESLNREIVQSQSDIESVTGVKPNLFRPPYGSSNQSVINTILNSGQKSVMWSIDTEDWKNRDPNTILSVMQTYLKPGSIALLHDIHPTTAQSLPQILEYVKNQGYQPVTISELTPYIEDTYNNAYYGR